MVNLEQRMAIERQVVLFLIQTMKAHGWVIESINDGGEPDEDIVPTTEDEAMDAVFAVDEAVIYFYKELESKRGKTHSAFIVLGNDGWDAIADHTCGSPHANDDFAKLMDEVVYPFCETLSGG